MKNRKKRKNIIIVTVIILTLAITGLAGAVKASTKVKAFVDVETRLNMRKGPGTQYEIIGKLLSGDVVTVYADVKTYWVRVKTSEGKEGYVSSEYLKFASLNTDKYELMATSIISSKNSSENRNYNMSKACESINGLVLLPDQQYDWYGVNGVGEASVARGYKQALVIQDGQFTVGEGGGVCQVSTALYRCILQLGIEPDIVHHHSKEVSYVPYGQDAAVSYGTKNFVFTNTKDYAIMFEAHTDEGNVIIKAYKYKIL